VTEEISAYTEKLATLENAITALETELEGKAGGGSIEAWTGMINILGSLGGTAPSVYYTDKTLTTRILGDGARIEDEIIMIAANTPIFISSHTDLVLNNAEEITCENDIFNYNCNVIRPTANNFSISN
jgi:hypothetical protein